MWRIYDEDGQLAITLGWQKDHAEPQETRVRYVGTAKTADWPGLVGRTVSFTGNVGVAYDNRGVRRILDTGNTAHWRRVIDTRPVKKPRKGRRQGEAYDWKWHNGRWQKVWV